MSLEESVAAQLRTLRLDKGITLTAMAEAIDVGKGHLSQIEKNTRPLPLDTLSDICKVLCVKPSTVIKEAEK